MNKNSCIPMLIFGVLLVSLLVVSFSGCSTPVTYLPEGVYYVDAAAGNDSADGLSTQTAFRSIDKLNYSVFAPGSQVLFRSGQIFRGSLKPSSGSSAEPVSYGTYGGDTRAVIQNSVALDSLNSWVSAGGGIWRADFAFSEDVGNIIFNNSSCAVRKWEYSALNADGDYFFDRFWKTLYLKSAVNPASVYSSIEAALTEQVIDQSGVSYASFSGLHIRYGGAHGFGGGNTTGLSITDCELSYLGGGLLYYKDGEPVRYGNGVEFWGNASGNRVESCYIHDIYDTGLTNQNHTASAVQQNIVYRNNVIENCGLASFEFWNRPAASVTSGIVFENNTSVNPGSGWGVQRPDVQGSHVSVFGNEAVLSNVVIRKNIFYGGNLVYFLDPGTFASAGFSADSNCLFPVQDGTWDYLCLVWDGVSIASSNKYESGQMTELRIASGREQNSLETDPLFSAGAYPFNTSAGSPCPDWGRQN